MMKYHDSVAQYRPDNDYEQMVQTFTTIGLAAVLPGIWCIVTSMAPFAAFQWFGFAAFCKLQKHEMGNFPEEVIEYGQIHNLTMPGQEDKPTWCYEEPPIPYIHVGGMPQFKEPFRLRFCVLNFSFYPPIFSLMRENDTKITRAKSYTEQFSKLMDHNINFDKLQSATFYLILQVIYNCAAFGSSYFCFTRENLR